MDAQGPVPEEIPIRTPDKNSGFFASDQNLDSILGTLLAQIWEVSQDIKQTNKTQDLFEQLETASLKCSLFAADAGGPTGSVTREVYNVPPTQDIYFGEGGHFVNRIKAKSNSRTQVIRTYGSFLGFAVRVPVIATLLRARLHGAIWSLSILRGVYDWRRDSSILSTLGELDSAVEEASEAFQRSIEQLVDLRETIRIANSRIPSELSEEERIKLISQSLAEAYEKSTQLSGRWLSLRHMTENTDSLPCSLGLLTHSRTNPLGSTFPSWQDPPAWYREHMHPGAAYLSQVTSDQDVAIALSHDKSALNPTRARLFDGLSAPESARTSALLSRAIQDPDAWMTTMEHRDNNGFRSFILGDGGSDGTTRKKTYLVCGTRSVVAPRSSPSARAEGADSLSPVVAHHDADAEYCYALRIREVQVDSISQSGIFMRYGLEQETVGRATIESYGRLEYGRDGKLVKRVAAMSDEDAVELAGGETCRSCGHVKGSRHDTRL